MIIVEEKEGRARANVFKLPTQQAFFFLVCDKRMRKKVRLRIATCYRLRLLISYEGSLLLKKNKSSRRIERNGEKKF
jgi:hypothetical protein